MEYRINNYYTFVYKNETSVTKKLGRKDAAEKYTSLYFYEPWGQATKARVDRDNIDLYTGARLRDATNDEVYELLDWYVRYYSERAECAQRELNEYRESKTK